MYGKTFSDYPAGTPDYLAVELFEDASATTGAALLDEAVLWDATLVQQPVAAAALEPGTPCFLAMNRFPVRADCALLFEERWAERESQLHLQPGLIGFSLLRRRDPGLTIDADVDRFTYSTATLWASQAAWTGWREGGGRNAHAASQQKQRTPVSEWMDGAASPIFWDVPVVVCPRRDVHHVCTADQALRLRGGGCVPAAQRLAVPAALGSRGLAHAQTRMPTRRRLLGSALAASMWQACGSSAAAPPDGGAAADNSARFEADDKSFFFSLPEGWVGVTAPGEERASSGHLIAVSAATTVATAKRLGSGAVLRAVVDGGVRGRAYGSSLAALGPLRGVASELVSEELLNDAAATSAAVLDAEEVERTSRSPPYYIVRYVVNFKPVIAKLTIVQDRLYCVKVRATEERSGSFFDEESALRQEMEAIVRSFRVAQISRRCVRESNQGSVPADNGRACSV